jgi:transposase
MEFFTGLDVGMDETAICVVDDKGKVALETTVVTDPVAFKVALRPYLGRLRRVGHEAGALSLWLHPELLKLGLPAVCLETQHVRSALSAQRNKIDAADALGIAHIMRTGCSRCTERISAQNKGGNATRRIRPTSISPVSRKLVWHKPC